MFFFTYDQNIEGAMRNLLHIKTTAKMAEHLLLYF